MSGFSMGHLRYLHEAVRLSGIRAAANALNVAPSAVSRQIALLEKAARTPLLETNRRGAKPTDAGLILLDYYREHLSREEALLSKLDGIHGLQHGNVTLGAGHGFTDDLMRHALREFNVLHPNVKIALRLGSVTDVLNWLEEDEVHLGLAYGPGLHLHAARLKEIAAAPQPVCAIVSSDHPLTQWDVVTVDALIEYPFALARPGYGTRKIVEQIEASERRQFNVVLETDHLIGLTSFVRAGMGVTLLPAYAVHDDIERGALKALPIAHELMQEVQAQLVIRRGRELPLGALKLQRLLTANMLAFKT